MHTAVIPLSPDEFEFLRLTDGPAYFEIRPSNLRTGRTLQARGLLGKKDGDVIFVTPMGKLAMRLHRRMS